MNEDLTPMISILLAISLGCSRSAPCPADCSCDDTDSAVDTSADDTAGHDTSADDTATDDTATDDTGGQDTGWWECEDDGIIDDSTLCWGHRLLTCDNASVGLRRGDSLCWPAHAFCPDSTPCDDTTEAWVDLPLALPSDFRAVAEGVISDPVEVFVSPVDGGFTPTSSLMVHSCTEATNAFYYGTVGPGEEVVMADGTYSDCYIAFYDDGASGQPIRFRAETPGGVTLTHSSVYMEGSYLVLSGFTFTGTMLYTPVSMGDSGVPCDYCAVRDVRIDNVLPVSPMSRPYVQVVGRRTEVSDSTFVGKANTSSVITVDRANPADPIEARVYRNAFLDRTNAIHNEGETNGFEVIRVGWSMDYFYPAYTVIEGNLFERCDGELETLSIKSGGNAVRFNTFRDNAGQISVRDGFGNVVEGNYILGEDKPWSGGIRASGARTWILNNHVQDLHTGDSVWRYPITLVTGAEDHYENYTSTFDSAVLFNRVVSPDDAFALDTEDDYGPVYYSPHDNLYQDNLLFTLGNLPVVAWQFEDSYTGNTILDNWTDVDLGLDGFVWHDASAVSDVDGISRVSDYEDGIASATVGDALTTELFDSTTIAQALDMLVLDDTSLYERVPVLQDGDVGSSH